MRRILVLLVLVAACSASGPPTPVGAGDGATTTALASESTVSTPPSVPDLLEDFAVGVVEVDGEELLVAVADTSSLRQRGLMGVTDLGDLDGMLFVFTDATTSGFWMKDTLIALDIAFFDGHGAYVDGFPMEPCEGDPCPTYAPAGPYRYALEAPVGDLSDVGPASVLGFP